MGTHSRTSFIHGCASPTGRQQTAYLMQLGCLMVSQAVHAASHAGSGQVLRLCLGCVQQMSLLHAVSQCMPES